MNWHETEALARWKYGPRIDLETAKVRREMLHDADEFMAKNKAFLAEAERTRARIFGTKRVARVASRKHQPDAVDTFRDILRKW